MAFMIQFVIILIASKLAGSISVKLGQPSVLGKLLVGIILGPSLLGWVNESDALAVFSGIGVVLLMFIAGLETDMGEFKRAGAASVYVGFGGILAPLGLGYAAGIFMEMTVLEAWFLGLLLSATSVSISVQALKEMNQLKSREGATILGAAVIDDVVVIIALAFLMSFGSSEVNLTLVIVKKVLFFAIAIGAAWKLVPWFMRRFSSLKVTETVISAALIICLVFAVFAEYAGVAAIIGAYIAGVAVSRTGYRREVFEKVETIGYSVFVPVFFASIGIAADFSGLKDNWLFIVIMSVFAVLTKLVGASAGAKLAGFGWRSSLAIGSAMVSRGEVALIMATIGLESGLLDADLFAALVVVVLVTTIVTPPLMKLFLRERQP